MNGNGEVSREELRAERVGQLEFTQTVLCGKWGEGGSRTLKSRNGSMWKGRKWGNEGPPTPSNTQNTLWSSAEKSPQPGTCLKSGVNNPNMGFSLRKILNPQDRRDSLSVPPNNPNTLSLANRHMQTQTSCLIPEAIGQAME